MQSAKMPDLKYSVDLEQGYDPPASVFGCPGLVTSAQRLCSQKSI